MNQMSQYLPAILVLVLTVASGLGDAEGFLHAARIWNGKAVAWGEILKSALGFGLGVVAYWGAASFMNELGMASPEIQTLIWFAVTIITVAVLGGSFLNWHLGDQVVAGLVLAGIGWLVWRTG